MQRAQLGQFVPLNLVTKNSAGIPTVPDAAPTVSIYRSSDDTKCIDSQKVAPLTFDNKVFQYDLQLTDSDFQAGQFVALWKYQISSQNRRHLEHFEIIPGGHLQGAYTALTYVEYPQASFLVASSEDGTIDRRRNPYIS